MAKKIRRQISDFGNDLCVVYVAEGYDEANLIRNKLNAFGIPATVRSDGVYPPSLTPSVGVTGGVFSGTGIRVFVPRKYQGSASKLVRAKPRVKPINDDDSFIKLAARQPYVLFSPVFLIPWLFGWLFTNIRKWLFLRKPKR
jgi:hypothetical protein